MGATTSINKVVKRIGFFSAASSKETGGEGARYEKFRGGADQSHRASPAKQFHRIPTRESLLRTTDRNERLCNYNVDCIKLPYNLSAPFSCTSLSRERARETASDDLM